MFHIFPSNYVVLFVWWHLPFLDRPVRNEEILKNYYSGHNFDNYTVENQYYQVHLHRFQLGESSNHRDGTIPQIAWLISPRRLLVLWCHCHILRSTSSRSLSTRNNKPKQKLRKIFREIFMKIYIIIIWPLFVTISHIPDILNPDFSIEKYVNSRLANRYRAMTSQQEGVKGAHH